MYVVEYYGKFGFIKPNSSNRDDMVVSQKILTPSILYGIEKKLFPNIDYTVCKKIIRNKLHYKNVAESVEQMDSIYNEVSELYKSETDGRKKALIKVFQGSIPFMKEHLKAVQEMNAIDLKATKK